jgi:hypothetical protein
MSVERRMQWTPEEIWMTRAMRPLQSITTAAEARLAISLQEAALRNLIQGSTDLVKHDGVWMTPEDRDAACCGG